MVEYMPNKCKALNPTAKTEKKSIIQCQQRTPSKINTKYLGILYSKTVENQDKKQILKEARGEEIR
jgi:hypothetical protein